MIKRRKSKPVYMDKVPGPGLKVPLTMRSIYFKIANDLLDRGVLMKGHKGPIADFCNALVRFRKNYSLFRKISKYTTSLQDYREAKDIHRQSLDYLDDFTRKMFDCDLDHLRDLGIDIPK